MTSAVEAHPTVTPVYPRRRWPWVVAAIVALALVGTAVWYFAIRDTGSSDTVHGPSGAPFTVTKPPGWTALPTDQLASLPGNPLAVVRQSNGTGIVIINSQPQSSASLTKLSKQLQTKLKQTIPDYKLIGAKTINIPAGQAISITYARTQKGTANTLVVIPAGGHIYTLNAVVPAGEKDTAKQAADIINSFNG
jgi:hypothetical protein